MSDFNKIVEIANAMGKLGFWMKLTSPFMPTDYFKPRTRVEEWEKDRYFWYASFDLHGMVDSNLIWHGGDEDPLKAVCLAAEKVVLKDIFEYIDDSDSSQVSEVRTSIDSILHPKEK